MADETRDQPHHQSIEDHTDEVEQIHEQTHQLIEDYNDEVVEEIHDQAQHLIEEYSDEVESSSSSSLSFDEEGDEDEDEDETASCSSEEVGGEENGGGGEWNRSEIDGLFCPICMEAWTDGGDHQVCCLPCGHIYGLSCIKTWIQRSRSSRKCPQCNQKSTLKDVRVLYASRVVAVDEELQKKVLSLEAKCASLKKKNSKYYREVVKRQNKEDDLLLQLKELSEFMAEEQTREPEPSYEQGEANAEANPEAELEASSLVPYEKEVVNILHTINARSRTRFETQLANINTMYDTIKVHLGAIEEYISQQPGEHHFPPWPKDLLMVTKGEKK